MKTRILRITPASLAKTFAICSTIAGIFVGLFGVVASFTGVEFTMKGPISLTGRGLEMLPFAITYPLLCGLVGGVGGYLVALIYNFSVRFTQGIEVETVAREPGEPGRDLGEKE